MGRHAEHCDIDLARIVEHGLVSLDAKDLGILRMHRNDGALIAAIDEVLHHRVADLAGLGGGADHSDSLRVEDAIHRREDFVLARTIARLLGLPVADDARIDRCRPVRGGEDRVKVDFGDFGEIRHQLGDLDDDAGKRGPVDRRLPANALENLRRLQAVEHRFCVGLAGRGKVEGDVLQHLDQNAAKAEGDELAERGVADRADDDFRRAGGQHLLDLDALDARVRLVAFRIVDDGLERRACLVGRVDTDHDAAGLGLMQDVRRDDLHDDREAHTGSEIGRLIGRLRQRLFRHRDLIGITNEFRFRRRQSRSSRRFDCIEHTADGCLVAHLFLPMPRRLRCVILR